MNTNTNATQREASTNTPKGELRKVPGWTRVTRLIWVPAERKIPYWSLAMVDRDNGE